MADIKALLVALKDEVDRISATRATSDFTQEELSSIFLEAIHKTLKEIKMGADSEDFQELTIINFIILADEANFSKDLILSFVQELKKTDRDLQLSFPEQAYTVETEKLF